VETEGVEIEVSISKYDLDRCNSMDVSWLVTQRPTVPQGLGSTYLRREIQARQYSQYQYHGANHPDGILMAARRGESYSFKSDALYNAVTVFHNYDAQRSAQKQGVATREAIHLCVESDKTVILANLKTLVNKIAEAVGSADFV